VHSRKHKNQTICHCQGDPHPERSMFVILRGTLDRNVDSAKARSHCHLYIARARHDFARPLFCAIVFLSLSLSVGFAQQCAKSPPEGQNSSTASSASSTATPQEREFGIQDNSFLVEEAYNQEFGVVQHIQSFQRLWNRGDWAYTFTQEWPVDPSPRNQLSYTLTAFHSGDQPGTGGGFGDVILNYRYQALGSGESTLAFSPRLSVLFPTGDASLGRGQGGAGLQTMLPMSLVLTKSLATHWNAGATFIPHARNSAGDRATTFGYNFGQSFAWLVRPRFNVLLETVFYRNQRVTANHRTVWNSDLFLNPGIRWAYNFHNGLQIVPGIAIPVGVGSSSGTRGVFLYLSFEHPYRKLPKKSSP
jgi:hypothetical protein